MIYKNEQKGESGMFVTDLRVLCICKVIFEFGNESMLLNFEYSSPHSLASPS